MSNTSTALRSVPVSPEAKAREYRRIQAEIKNLEDLAKVFRDDLEQLAQAAGGTLNAGQYRIKAIPFKRENFSLKNARQALGDKVLAPFVSVSEGTQLRISIIDENEATDTPESQS